MQGRSSQAEEVLIMYSYTAQWSRLDAADLLQAEGTVHFIARARTVARIAGRVAAAVGFAGVMWLLLAGPGFLDGRSSTADHPAQQVAALKAGR